MKATLDIPDDLYRRVKARSAMEGRPVRSVAVQLFQRWLNDEPEHAAPLASKTPSGRKPTRFEKAPWLAILKPYIRPGMTHDMDEVRAALAKGWSAEIREKLNPSPPKS